MQEDNPVPQPQPQCDTTSPRNPTGKNQYRHCPPANDGRVKEILTSYHRHGITDRRLISRLLLDEDPSIQMSEATVARRLKKFGLFASGLTTKLMPEAQKKQYILDQISKDSTRKRAQGSRSVKKGIAQDEGVFLTRDYIESEMRNYDNSQAGRR